MRFSLPADLGFEVDLLTVQLLLADFGLAVDYLTPKPTLEYKT